MHDLSLMLAKFEEFVSRDVCEKLAIKHGLVQRSTSQLRGYEFAQAMMIPNGFLEAETLNSLAQRMRKINKTCNLSAPALAQRINTKMAVNFMKASFGKILKEIIKRDLPPLPDLLNLSVFNRVLIEDSTQATLHEGLSPYFKGSGGLASKSAIKFNFTLDYLREEIVDIEFFSGKVPDQSLAGRIAQKLVKADLVIRDLGYYALKNLKQIEECGAYYITRGRVDVDIYESKEALKPLNLAKFLDKHAIQDVVDAIVFLGEDRCPVRLVACLMSEEATNKKMREANKSARSRGTTVSKKAKDLAKWVYFLTNVPNSMLSSESVIAAYRGRWRVEIIFKQWKSCLKIHLFKGYDKKRFYCFLYGRLIMILLIGSINSLLMGYVLQMGRELSSIKLANYLIADNALFEAIRDGKIEQFIKKLLEDILRRLCMDKRKRPSLRSNVRMGNTCYKRLKIKELYKMTA